MIKIIFALLAALVLSSGCARQYVMRQADMYLAPTLEPEHLPEKIAVVPFKLSPGLDMAEGLNGRRSWPAVMWCEGEEEAKYLAVKTRKIATPDCHKIAAVVIPRPLPEIKDCRIALLDHGGTRVYQPSGESRKLKSLTRKIKPEDYSGSLVRVGEYAREMRTNSEEFKELAVMYLQFRIDEVKTHLDAKYGFNDFSSSLAKEQLLEIAKSDTVVASFIDWAGRDWMVFITVPFIGVDSTLVAAGLVKVFTIPSIWGDKIDRPGYFEYKPDAETVAEMTLTAGYEYYSCWQNKLRK